MLNSLKKIFGFSSKEVAPQVTQTYTLTEAGLVFPNESLSDTISDLCKTRSNSFVFTKASSVRNVLEGLYKTLKEDMIDTVDPELSLDYSKWILESHSGLTNTNVYHKLFENSWLKSLEKSKAGLIILSVIENNKDHLDADEYATLMSFDLNAEIGSFSLEGLETLFNKSSKKKSTELYVTYSNMVYELFSTNTI
jgi:hypothetical protein